MTRSSSAIAAIPCSIAKLGRDGMHYFFGYYNKSTWNAQGTQILANRVPYMDRDLTPELEAEVGYFDSVGGDFHTIGTTSAWNWQMGCQLQWLEGQGKRQVIYNVRHTTPQGKYPNFGSVIHDLDSGESRTLADPIYSVAPDSSYAITVDYRRLYITHETIGYAEIEGEKLPVEHCPADDGVCRVDLDTGDLQVLVSYDELKNFHYRDSMANAIHWVSHIEINPASNRILFLHRWTERVEDETCFLHRLITINSDGSDMRLLECSDHPLPQLAEDFDPNAVGTYDYEKSEYQISHPLWKSDDEIIVWGPHDGEIHYHLYHDAPNGKVSVVGRGILTENGHMSYSPVNSRWLLTDTYPDAETNIRKLLIFDTQEERAIEIGEFYTSDLKKENRCDLHPRWNHQGTQVCIDSVHDNERQMYIIDVTPVIN
ncbi:hypothetical protein [Halomonas icarae]|uniref:Oligogalacturonate lyase domain-containing protein n=1 Tax=Halomonas icarae TaxID=2691040 RepID=A0A7X4VZ61_9GAMM|nr:hypothetical protein [Halomonas icarae]MDR5903099.1 hypothetical protein [Halomonas icarae]NAW12921.1 hypothetical protein [Halomonas icarae]